MFLKTLQILKKSRNGVIPIFKTAKNDHTDVRTVLLENKQMSTKNGKMMTYVLLLENNAKVNEKWEKIIIFQAAKNGHTDVFTMLLQNNANVQEKGENGVTRLFVSAEKGYTDIITDLLKKTWKCTLKREKCRNSTIHDSEER